MTVITTVNKQFATGNGVTTSFSFPFRCILASHLEVYVDEELVDAGDYTVTLNASGVGGAVVFDTAPANGLQVLIYRYVSYTQESALPNESDFQQITLENMVDKLTMECQQLQEQLNRAALGSKFIDDGVQITLPEPDGRRALLWHPDEDGRLINSTYDPDAIIDDVADSLALMASYLAAAEAARDAAIAAQDSAEESATQVGEKFESGFPDANAWQDANQIGDMLVWQEVAPSVFGFGIIHPGTGGQILQISAEDGPVWADNASSALYAWGSTLFLADGDNTTAVNGGVTYTIDTSNCANAVIYIDFPDLPYSEDYSVTTNGMGSNMDIDVVGSSGQFYALKAVLSAEGDGTRLSLEAKSIQIFFGSQTIVAGHAGNALPIKFALFT